MLFIIYYYVHIQHKALVLKCIQTQLLITKIKHNIAQLGGVLCHQCILRVSHGWSLTFRDADAFPMVKPGVYQTTSHSMTGITGSDFMD